MPKPKGPPYNEPGCKYVVIDNPWPGGKSGKARDARYFNYVAVWLSMILSPRVWPEELYYVSTRRDIIAKFAEEVDITPMLGVHFWPNFSTERNAPPELTYIFPFNYRMLGHPDEHNWTQHVPAGDPPPHVKPASIKQPYPRPAYAGLDPRMSCKSLALPMPLPPDREEKPPTPPPSPPRVENHDPDDRPAHYRFAHDLPDGPQDPTPAQLAEIARVQALRGPPRPLFVDKLDPYDQEDDALRFLKGEHADNDPPIKTEPKVEEGDREVSAELSEWIAKYNEMLAQESAASQHAGPSEAMGQEQGLVTVKQEPTSQPYRGSEELRAAIEEFEATRMREAQAARAQRPDGAVVKPEPQEARLPIQEPAASTRTEDDPRFGRVKPEPREPTLADAPRGPKPTHTGIVKPEPVDMPLPGPARVLDPRRARAQSSSKRIKVEGDEYGSQTKRTRR